MRMMPLARTLPGILLLMAVAALDLQAGQPPAPSAPPAPLTNAVALETPALRLQVSPDDGRYAITDAAGGVTWHSNPYRPRFGSAEVTLGGKRQGVELAKCSVKKAEKALELTFLIADKADDWVRVNIGAKADKTLAFSYEAAESVSIESIRLLDDALFTTAGENGYVVMPVREGMIIPASSGLAFTHSFDTYNYEGCHMAMCGMVKGGAAALLAWDDPYVAAEVRSALPAVAPASVPAGRDAGATGKGDQTVSLSLSLSLRKSAKSFTLTLLGKGDYVSIAKAYRPLAKEKGWLVTWDEKLKSNPNRAKLFGAANVKLWSCLHRRMNEDCTKELESRANWTFDEVAQVAEHVKNDLKLDRVHFIIGGWMKRGYDNQHPDILPTAPECGGDDAFSKCAKRVRGLGYIFDLHDNYQDMYRDAPSWNEEYIQKTRDGKLQKGGHWAGGVAYITCSQKALELAKRPQNLTAVKKLSDADSYFIDTTYACGLQECFDPKHPLTRTDDMKWKQALSDYARDVFGMFGSECGREWAIPHADYFEGLTGVSGGYYHDAGLTKKLGATVVPLFEIVYRDCIAMYGKYGYDINSAAEYVLHHISIGRTLNYHNIPSHLYWKTSAADEKPMKLKPSVANFKSEGARKFSLSYLWKVEEALGGDWTIFVHFTDKSGKEIKFQGDHKPTPALSDWKPGEIREGPFTVSVPEGQNGPFNIYIGMFRQPGFERARLLDCDKERRCLLGKIDVANGEVKFTPPEPVAAPAGDAGTFVHGDNGWTAGMHPQDRFLKNTQEILGPLNELTAQMQMTEHQFLTADRNVRRSVFGSGENAVAAIVNMGSAPYSLTSKIGGEVVLQPYGFLIESPTFVAFSALSFNGIKYGEPVLFTLRSQDSKPLAQSEKVRVFHGFGDARIKLGGKEEKVEKEAVVSAK
ncbi:MAG TPA: DUF5696 domain-containing protein [Planctomycetota bacterium]|jgi:hypothetical protein